MLRKRGGRRPKRDLRTTEEKEKRPFMVMVALGTREYAFLQMYSYAREKQPGAVLRELWEEKLGKLELFNGKQA